MLARIRQGEGPSQTQQALAASDVPVRFITDPETPELSPLTETSINSGRAAILIEQLTCNATSDPVKALAQVKELLTQVTSVEARDLIVKALRTETPTQFATEEVRLAALKALTPYAYQEERYIAPFIEELEDHPRFATSCAQAVQVLNAVGSLHDPEYCQRIVTLFDRYRSNSDYTQILSRLEVGLRKSIELTESDKLIESVRSAACQNSVSYIDAKALALSKESRAISLLTQIATKELRSKFNFGDAIPRTDGSELSVILAFAGVVGTLTSGAIGGAIAHSAWGFLCGAILLPLTIYGIVPSVRYFTSSEERRCCRAGTAETALKALSYALPNSSVQDLLVNALADSKVPDDVKTEIAKGLAYRGSTWNAKELLNNLKSDSHELRYYSLIALTRTDNARGQSAAARLTEDPDKKVRQLAYAIVDGKDPFELA